MPDEPQPIRLVIAGFMGAGKSSIAQALSKRLLIRMIDLDHFIQTLHCRTLREIIDMDGETVFRNIETRALGEVLARKTARIIALGGGAWAIETNRLLIEKSGALSVWIDASFDLCWKRISGSGLVRPFVREMEEARKRFEARRATYQLCRIHIMASENSTPDELAKQIIDLTGIV
ncbi:MAG: shikimate kinase [Pyrinomonadaceae bacterium]